ncbi:unnamed protein product [Adineta steineri]|uniref:F-box domain-containing protein n=1 Tax=Adineta steineri TaxID=433720 RepID=A0A816EBI0_9BILA|nr:unnamed protein product [Adineta steineri]CAF1645567.1 unnamed protein product [Adineta steineri]
MNTSHHHPPNPNEIVGNRRPARPSSAQLRSTTPTRNRQQHNNTTSNGLNTTAKLEQSILKHDLDRTTMSTNSQKLNGKGKNRLYSTWTPLQDEETNARLFEERKLLLNKWFEKWTDDQRRVVLDDLMGQSRPRQLTYTRNLLTKRFPAHHNDFTRLFPRVLCLYIFSYLDPRSLCRCAQVCWYWKFLTESDQIWMPKCLRFGWTPKYSPSSFESNVWKRVYTFNIQALQTMPVRDYSQRSQSAYYDDQSSSRQNTARSHTHTNRNQHNQSHLSSSSRTNRNVEHPPWRANSRNPSDTLRFNYLDNDDSELESLIAKHRKQGTSILHPTESDHELKNTTKERQGRNRVDDRHEHNGSIRRSQSLSARGSPSVSFRDDHTSRNSNHNNSYLNRPPSTSGFPNRPADMPRPPSSAQKSKYSSKIATNEASNRTWHTMNNDNYIDE